VNYLFSFLVGFFFGSLPWGYWLVKWIKHTDIREVGSHNIGATNVWRVYGKKLGLLTFILDTAKGGVPVFIFNHYFTSTLGIISGIGAILGHSFTPWLKFKGGKGVATGLGVFGVLVPVEIGISFGVWLIVRYVVRMISIASIVAGMVLVILVYTRKGGGEIFWFVLGIFLLVVIRHKSNIIRIIQGKEHKV
jgi:glycerol-3-phosphate acyltransferase PlsY